MGSYTDVAIAIDKNTYVRHALLQKVPTILTNELYVEDDGALHWYLEGQRWLHNDAEIQDLYSFFEVLEEEGDIETDRTWKNLTGQVRRYTRSRFGCTLLHENGDVEEFGYPCDFEIAHVTYLDCHGRDAMLKREEEARAATRAEEATE